MANSSKGPRRGAVRRRATVQKRGSVCEWVGGRFPLTNYVRDGEEPYRPEMAVWLELSSELVVGHEVVHPESATGALGRALEIALEQPLAGPPRRPDVIRVGDAAAGAEVRSVVGDSIPIRIAPTPELEELLDAMSEAMGGGGVEMSYLDDGRISPETVGDMFSAARVLHVIAPWKAALDDDILRMDIPTLGVDGACVCIIGHLGEDLGVLVFPSLDGYKAFARAAARSPREGRRVDMGSDWLALSFGRGADLSDTERREAATHGWNVAGPDAYPTVTRYDRDGAPRPPVERDVKIAAAAARSLSAFFAKHRALFEADEFEPVCESFFDGDDLEVRFTIPYEAFDMFEIEPDSQEDKPPPVRSRKIGRNDRCYCGSGRKYKQCHLPIDEEQGAGHGGADPHHDLDRRLTDDLMRFAAKRFGPAWDFWRDFRDAEASAQLAVLWSVYHYRVEGASVLDHYLEKKSRRLSREERGWLEAQRASWLSVWEAVEVEPGENLTLRDLLSGEERRVTEVGVSQTLVARDALLARVVDYEGVSLLCGVYPQSLPPVSVAEVVRRARAKLRRKRVVPVERLRDERFGRALIRYWEEELAALLDRPRFPRELQNTDGDALLLTTDHFDIAPGKTSEVKVRLAAIPGVEPPEPGEGPPAYTFIRPGNPLHKHWDNTVVGHVRISGRSLRAETNSCERADALREGIESACGDRIRHRLREHADPLSAKASHGRGDPASVVPPGIPAGMIPGSPPGIPQEDMDRMAREFKERHYRAWPDEPIPALNGKTPREAVKTAQGREAVDVLLKDIENREQRERSAARFDVSQLRRQLGLR